MQKRKEANSVFEKYEKNDAPLVFLFVGLFLRFVKDMPYALSDKEARLSFFPAADD